MSVTDVVFSLLDIKKKEREEIFSLYEALSVIEDYYSREIESKYAEEGAKIMESLEASLSEEEWNIFFVENVGSFVKRNLLENLRGRLDEKQLLCLESIIECQETDSEEITEQEIEEMKTRSINQEKRQYSVVSGVVGMGVFGFVMILLAHIELEAAVVNLLTEIAFLCVILNILIKDCYKEKSLKEISSTRAKVKREMADIIRR